MYIEVVNSLGRAKFLGFVKNSEKRGITDAIKIGGIEGFLVAGMKWGVI